MRMPEDPTTTRQVVSGGVVRSGNFDEGLDLFATFRRLVRNTMISSPVARFDLLIFGGSGDLARRKLLPALYCRDAAGQLPVEARIIGIARANLDTDSYRNEVRAALTQFAPRELIKEETLACFLGRIDYIELDFADVDWDSLAALLNQRKGQLRVFYLAVDPSLFGPVCEGLSRNGFIESTSRVVIEKPFGYSLSTARDLNAQIARVFDERAIYRIDHYLGKETVQNLMALRFANALFEPIWNSRHIHHIQITVAESVGVEGRGAYYDRSGAMRDMVQNHLLQLLCLVAMEPPAQYTADAVRDEKLKILRALEPIDPDAMEDRVVRGQYRGRDAIGSYLTDVGTTGSRAETFVALRASIANWRWAGTPFYLRTGKRLSERLSEIAVVFKDVPHSIFSPGTGLIRRNVLVVRLQPDEGITLQMMIKDPGPGGLRLQETSLDMTFARALSSVGERMPDAYERLLLDVVRGDQTLFMRSDEVEAAWTWVDPIIAAWDRSQERPFSYDPGSSGPDDALRLLHRDGLRWRDIAVWPA